MFVLLKQCWPSLGGGAIISHFPETPSPVSVLTAIIFLFLDAFLICTLLPFRKIHVWALPDYLLEPESSRLKQFQNAILHPHVNFNITIVTFFLLFRKHRKRPTLIWKHYVHVDWDLEFIFQWDQTLLYLDGNILDPFDAIFLGGWSRVDH